jgi:hypothetical protein
LLGQAAAPVGSVESERRDDDVASWGDGVVKAVYVSLPICGLGQEVEYRTVVPHINGWVKAMLQHVAHDPRHLACSIPESAARRMPMCRGQVEDRDIRVAPVEEVIHQP